jgi:hypothetical protein
MGSRSAVPGLCVRSPVEIGSAGSLALGDLAGSWRDDFFQQTRTSSARQLTRGTVFASAGLVAASTVGGAPQNVLAAERTDCIIMERSARVLSLLQAERTAFAAVPRSNVR